MEIATDFGHNFVETEKKFELRDMNNAMTKQTSTKPNRMFWICRLSFVVGLAWIPAGALGFLQSRPASAFLVPQGSKLERKIGLSVLRVGHQSTFPSFLESLQDSLESTEVLEEGLNGMIHATLDFTAFFKPATALVRLASVCGRVLLITSDFLPGHNVTPDEIMIQAFLLLIATNACFKSIVPMAVAYILPSELGNRDKDAFATLFEPSGVTWAQYKMLKHGALDWITVDPHVTIISDEMDLPQEIEGDEDAYSYWLYQGNMEVCSNGKVLYEVIRFDRNTTDPPGMGLVGETHLARALEDPAIWEDAESGQKTTVRAGDDGAILLRMSTSRLSNLIENDKELDQSITRLVFRGMRDKLNALMAAEA